MASETSLTFDEDALVGGLSDPSSTHYRHRRAVLDVANKLHSYGLHHQLDLPQVAVIGSQSVGKSSLIESISGIKLPRAKGTCTRCPIECRLSRSTSAWSCEVYLRFSDQVSEIPFGTIINDKSEVEERIRRAQLAILNPSRNALDFLGPLGELGGRMANEKSFSSDLVSVRISGKEVDDLSFVDLPGIIASVRDGGKDADIKAVRNLVLDVIRKPSCLILLVVSCETDFENQGARQLAKQVDRSGKRTIPVLTKPDRIPDGEQSSWIRLLANEEERFEHGWHCVKQPDQPQIDSGISWAEARQSEADFFENKSPWNTLNENVKSRLGTQFLTNALGGILFKLICKRLPDLLVDVEEKLGRLKEAIADLPPQRSGDPVWAVWKMKGAFEKDVKQLVEGRPEQGAVGLFQTFRRLREQFREAIFRQAPEFKPFERPAKHRAGGLEPPTMPPSPIDHSTAKESVTEEEALEPLGARDPGRFVYMNEVLETARTAITRELPHNYPYAVKKNYVARFTKQWPVPANQLFDDIGHHFLKELKALVTLHFSAYSIGGLEAAVLQTVLTHLKNCKERTAMKMKDCIALEHEGPVTVNEQYLADYKRKFLARYKAARQLHVKHSPELQKLVNGDYQHSSYMQNAVQYLQYMGLPSVNNYDLLRLLPGDPADDAIEIMAEVRAYYQVAFKRFVDYISMIIDFELLKGFERTLDDALFKGMGLGEDQLRQRCSTFLEEDPDIVRRRESLQQDLERFESALADLQNIPILDPSSTNSYGHNTETDEGHLTNRVIFYGDDDEPDFFPPPEAISRSKSHMESSLYDMEAPEIAGLPSERPMADARFTFGSKSVVIPSAGKKKRTKGVLQVS